MTPYLYNLKDVHQDICQHKVQLDNILTKGEEMIGLGTSKFYI